MPSLHGSDSLDQSGLPPRGNAICSAYTTVRRAEVTLGDVVTLRVTTCVEANGLAVRNGGRVVDARHLGVDGEA